MARPWDRLDRRSYRRLQEGLVRRMVDRYLYPLSPFYRKLFDEHGIKPRHVRGLRDLERVPLVSARDFDPTPEDPWRPLRAMLRPTDERIRGGERGLGRRLAVERLVHGERAAERVLADEFKPVHLHLPSDGGPAVGYTMRDLAGLAQAGARALSVLGASPSDLLVSTLPYGPDLSFWQIYYGAIGQGMTAAHLGGGEVVRPAQAAAWMEHVGATILVSQAGYAEGLLRAAPPATFDRLALLGLWAGPELRGAPRRFAARLRAGGVRDARVGTLLGIPEARVAWAECPAPASRRDESFGYHLYPDLELLEVVDEEGRTRSDGEPGELVYTSLDWRGSALLRYRTGIVARRGITWEPCPGCRRTVPRILADLSRVGWRIRVLGSRGAVDVDLADVIPILWRATGVALWQLEVERGAGQRGADRAIAHLRGATRDAAVALQKALAPFGVRCRMARSAELTERLRVGRERAERRVVIRG